jgi:hypothetical protein
MAAEDINTKRCPKCGEHKPTTCFYKQKHAKFGVGGYCESCSLTVNRAYREASPEKYRAREAARDRSAYTKKRWSEHREKISAEYRAWRLKNKRRVAEKMAEWREQNIGKHREWSRRWQKKNLEKCRANNAKRYAAKLRALPRWSELDKIALVYRKARQLRMEVDHIVPLQHELVCGLHVWHNLQLLHESENARKKNRHWPDMP